MSFTTLDDDRIKELFKQAMLELIQERKELLHELLVEVLEDIALVNAINEGEDTEAVSRDDVFQTLEGVA